MITVYERLVAFGQAIYDAGIDPRTVEVMLPAGSGARSQRG